MNTSLCGARVYFLAACRSLSNSTMDGQYKGKPQFSRRRTILLSFFCFLLFLPALHNPQEWTKHFLKIGPTPDFSFARRPCYPSSFLHGSSPFPTRSTTRPRTGAYERRTCRPFNSTWTTSAAYIRTLQRVCTRILSDYYQLQKGLFCHRAHAIGQTNTIPTQARRHSQGCFPSSKMQAGRGASFGLFYGMRWRKLRW